MAEKKKEKKMTISDLINDMQKSITPDFEKNFKKYSQHIGYENQQYLKNEFMDKVFEDFYQTSVAKIHEKFGKDYSSPANKKNKLFELMNDLTLDFLKKHYAKDLKAHEKDIAKMKDPEKRNEALTQLFDRAIGLDAHDPRHRQLMLSERVRQLLKANPNLDVDDLISFFKQITKEGQYTLKDAAVDNLNDRLFETHIKPFGEAYKGKLRSHFDKIAGNKYESWSEDQKANWISMRPEELQDAHIDTLHKEEFMRHRGLKKAGYQVKDKYQGLDKKSKK